MKNNIILIGMPGAGKSTIGAILSKSMNKPFMDTDRLIMQKENRKLQDIINSDGINIFSQIEEKIILEINTENHIISTGGSVVYSKAAMEHLKSLGIIIYLDARLFQIKQRIGNIGTRGIALRKGQTINSLYKERTPLYRKYADIIIDCSGKHAAAIANEITRLAEDLLSKN